MLIEMKKQHDEYGILAMIASMNGRENGMKQIQPGIYEIGHFGSSAWPNSQEYEHYPEFEELNGIWRNCYGVCDSVDDILELYADIIADPERQICITMTEIVRDQSNRGQGGGWRWHKWGPYIGKMEPTMEYLDDEPLIERVYVYHIYEKRQWPKNGQVFEDVKFQVFNLPHLNNKTHYWTNTSDRLIKTVLENKNFAQAIDASMLPIATGFYTATFKYFEADNKYGFTLSNLSFKDNQGNIINS